MSLVVVYGPVASGKLTVATEIAALTGYILFHNHILVDALAEIFPFGNDAFTEPRTKLNTLFKKQLYEEVLATKRDVVMTSNFGGERGRDFFEKLVDDARKYNEPIYFVRLAPDRASLFERVTQESRSNKVNTPERLEAVLAKEGYGFEEFAALEHLTVDNTHLSAKEVARQVIDHYNIKQRRDSL